MTPLQMSANAKAHGFACPECAAPIKVDLPSLLSQRAVRCSACGLELRVDESSSGPAMDELAKLDAAQEAVRRAARGP